MIIPGEGNYFKELCKQMPDKLEGAVDWNTFWPYVGGAAMCQQPLTLRSAFRKASGRSFSSRLKSRFVGCFDLWLGQLACVR